PISGAYASSSIIGSLWGDANGYYEYSSGDGSTVFQVDFQLEKKKQLEYIYVLSKLKGSFTRSPQLEINPEALITGRVTLKGYPVNDCRVQTYNPFESKSVETRTDPTGGYQFIFGSGVHPVTVDLQIDASVDMDPNLVKLRERRAQLLNMSESAFYDYYRVGVIDEFIDDYYRRVAQLPEADMARVQESALRLAYDCLQIRELDKMTQDYAKEVMVTLGAVFQSLIDMTDIVGKMTEIGEDGQGKEIADKLLAHVRKKLDELLRRFTAALGTSMSGDLPPKMQEGVRKLMAQLRDHGTGAFKNELKEVILAEGLRELAQGQLDAAARRCEIYNYSGDLETQSDLAYQFRLARSEETIAFVNSTNWRAMGNTLTDSVEEAAKIAKYVGAVVGWYQVIEKIEGISGAISKGISGAGVAYAISQFSRMGEHVATAVALQMGDLTQLPASTGPVPYAGRTPFAVTGIVPLATESNPLVDSLSSLGGLIDGNDPAGILAAIPAVLSTLEAYDAEAKASLHIYEQHILEGGSVPDGFAEKLLEAQNALMAVIDASIGLNLRLAQLALDDSTADYAALRAVLDRLILAAQTYPGLESQIEALLTGAGVMPESRLEIIDIDVPNGIFPNSPFTVIVTVKNGGVATISDGVMELIADSGLTCTAPAVSLSDIAAGETQTVEFIFTLDSEQMGARPGLSFRVSRNDEIHTFADAMLLLGDTTPPEIEARLPEPRRYYSRIDSLLFRIMDDRPLEGIHIQSLKLDGQAVDISGVALDGEGWLGIPISAVTVEGTHSLEMAVADRAGNSTVREWAFEIGQTLRETVALMSNPVSTVPNDLTFWTDARDDLELVVAYAEDREYVVYNQTLGALATGAHSFSWDGLANNGFNCHDRNYVISIRNGEGHEQVSALYTKTGVDSPVDDIRIANPGLNPTVEDLIVTITLNSAVEVSIMSTNTSTLSLTGNYEPGTHHIQWPIRYSDGTPYLGSELDFKVTVHKDTVSTDWIFAYEDVLDLERITFEDPSVEVVDSEGAQIVDRVIKGRVVTFRMTQPELTSYSSGYLSILRAAGETELWKRLEYDDAGGVYTAHWDSQGTSFGDTFTCGLLFYTDTGELNDWGPLGFEVTGLKGDIDGDAVPGLDDAILGLKVLTNSVPPAQQLNPESEVDGDGRTGMAEVFHVLEWIGGLDREAGGNQ
ncbi:FlgD immunoglobulin-like domain containing protein, partial [Thermodesulfobacteriota bacterium]